ncbi:hypothetical protein [Malacoplasma iowae]|uniref:hypothetical protein n=1 Tax=Malacoplasma iowae TaxID=2116 RepID=UPI002A18C20D|nr:hypothetical protein [Malacoplasma iowae]WPL37071.1 hypothetical protein QX179_01160 [Malacoplasma iowae]WPL38251.1 hypothetical protein QX182_01890 [Malacoplasma iowae]WPL40626.1 hypothetical protein QX184_03770 [Malacoplasma iowae]
MLTANDIVITIIGYLGAVGIAIFSMPEVFNVIRKKKTNHINMALFLILMISSFCFVISGFYNIAKDISSGVDAIKWSFALAVAIANVMSGLSAGIVVFVKTYNIIMGKKNKMTEEEYGNYRANKKNQEITKTN